MDYRVKPDNDNRRRLPRALTSTRNDKTGHLLAMTVDGRMLTKTDTTYYSKVIIFP